MSRRSFRFQPDMRARGRVGEAEAEDYLRRRGYRVIDRNVSTRAGEIDRIARDGDTLCFIEVKARANRAFGPAVEAIPVSKQRRLARAASLYLTQHPFDGPCRFDVLAMDLDDDGWSYTLVRDAFQAPG